MAKVIGLRLVGGAYNNGRYIPGWDEIALDDGTTIYNGDTSTGMTALLNLAEKKGHDTKRFRERLEIWVKTGQMPID